MFGVARLLDAVAFSMYGDSAVHHTVISGATEIAHHVLSFLPPTGCASAAGAQRCARTDP